MMTKIVSAAAVLAIAGSAVAQGLPWNLRGPAAFNDGALFGGSNSILATTSFYNNAFGQSNGGPLPGIIAAFPDAEFDSYWASGAGPNTADGANSIAWAGSAGPISVTASTALLSGGFGEPGIGVQSTLKEVNGVLGEAVFFARLTTIGEGSGLTSSDGGPITGFFSIFNDDLGQEVLATVNGPGVSAPGIAGDGSIVQQTVWLVTEVTETTLSDGTFVRSHDLYLTTAIPTPGAVALFGLAGLAAARRRRA